MLFAFAGFRSPAPDRRGNRAAARTNSPAGRAWRATARAGAERTQSLATVRASSAAPATSSSEAPVEAVTPAAIAPSTSGASAPERAVGLVGTNSASAALTESSELPRSTSTTAPASVGRAQRFEHAAAVGAERAVRAAAGGYDRHVRPGDLRHELGEAVRDRRAMRTITSPTKSSSARTPRVRHSTMSNAIRQC